MGIKVKTIKRFEYESTGDASKSAFDGSLVEMSDGKRQLRVTHYYGPIAGAVDALRAYVETHLDGIDIVRVR